MAHPKRWLLAILVLLVVASGAAMGWLFDGALGAQSLTAFVS